VSNFKLGISPKTHEENTLTCISDFSDFRFSASQHTSSIMADEVADLDAIDRDLNFVIMDYLISEGYPIAAKKFAMEANIQPPEETSIQARVEIRNAIHAGDIETAIAKINELNPEVSLSFFTFRFLLYDYLRSCTTHSHRR
jgi:glucose-induced degradation protein 8